MTDTGSQISKRMRERFPDGHAEWGDFAEMARELGCSEANISAHAKRLGIVPARRLPVARRFWSKVGMSERGCWPWLGFIDPKGYARFNDGVHRSRLAHAWAYEHFVRAIPDGLVIDHLCRVRSCVNPRHMQLVTPVENTRLGVAARRVRDAATAV